VLRVLPSDAGSAVLPCDVRVPYVVDLEAEGVLQVVARLLGVQAGHHGRAVGDVYYLQATSLRQGPGDVA
jgi:hypothetical protein